MVSFFVFVCILCSVKYPTKNVKKEKKKVDKQIYSLNRTLRAYVLRWQWEWHKTVKRACENENTPIFFSQTPASTAKSSTSTLKLFGKIVVYVKLPHEFKKRCLTRSHEHEYALESMLVDYFNLAPMTSRTFKAFSFIVVQLYHAFDTFLLTFRCKDLSALHTYLVRVLRRWVGELWNATD